MEWVEFIERLTKELMYEVSPSELHTYIEHYNQKIQALIDAGYSEKKAVAKQGKIQQIVTSILSNEQAPAFQKQKHGLFFWLLLIILSPLWGSVALAGFGLFLGAYLLIWCIPLTTGSLALGGLLGGGVAAVLSPLLMFDNLALGFIQLGVGLLAIAAGSLAAVATIYITKYWLMLHQFIWQQGIRKYPHKKAVIA